MVVCSCLILPKKLPLVAVLLAFHLRIITILRGWLHLTTQIGARDAGVRAGKTTVLIRDEGYTKALWNWETDC